MLAVTLVKYFCVDCGDLRRTQSRRIKPEGNRCPSCSGRRTCMQRLVQGGYAVTDATRIKQSAAHRGMSKPWMRRPMLKETREKVRIAKIGRPSWNAGVEMIPRSERLLREKLHDASSGMIRRVLKLTGRKKVTRTYAYLGYTREDLRARIMKLWKPGMCWENYGIEWQIDHIVPVAVLCRRGITDIATINALANLQPLWKGENLRKGCRVPDGTSENAIVARYDYTAECEN